MLVPFHSHENCCVISACRIDWLCSEISTEAARQYSRRFESRRVRSMLIVELIALNLRASYQVSINSMNIPSVHSGKPDPEACHAILFMASVWQAEGSLGARLSLTLHSECTRETIPAKTFGMHVTQDPIRKHSSLRGSSQRFPPSTSPQSARKDPIMKQTDFTSIRGSQENL